MAENNLQISIPKWVLYLMASLVAVAILLTLIFVLSTQISQAHQQAEEQKVEIQASASAQAEADLEQIKVKTLVSKLARAVTKNCLNFYEGLPATMNLSSDGRTVVINSFQPYQPT